MKKGLHLEYQECTITCACGNVLKTRSTKTSYFVETCSACSPAYTGKKVATTRTGKVEQFNKKYNLNK